MSAQSSLETPLAHFPVSRLPSGRLGNLVIDPRAGIGPDDAAIIAIYLSPALRVSRDRHGTAIAQLVQAGVLPNPVLSYSRDFITGGNTVDTTTAYNFTATWEISALVPLLAKQSAARANLRSVDLDVAWTEWQLAENARTAIYRVVGLREELASAREAEQELTQSAEAMRAATEAHEKTLLDFGAAKAAQQDAQATTLGLEQESEKQLLVLKRTLGIPSESEVRLRNGIGLPAHLDPPGQRALMDGLENRRLDLVALQEGYRSQGATVRAAILAQFPRITIGGSKASDTTNVHTEGFNISIDLPVFDRNQGVIATERATRQRLLDEYQLRVFEAHSDIATALADIRSLNKQVAASEQALPAFEGLVTSAEAALREGNTDVLAYYTARSGLLQRRIQLIKLKEQLLEAQAALELASGRFLPTNAAMHVK
ncbi:MAG: TolC family protein [Verrucomicrobia bacterium]|nr:TolC family protein [Verrucomicrobiota bacterium]